MNYGLRAALALTPMLLMLTATPCALADGTVNVTLEDASEGGNLSGMKMTATPDSVKAGRVTLHATNKSRPSCTRSSSCFRRQTALPCRMTIKRVGSSRNGSRISVSLRSPAGQVGFAFTPVGARQLSAYLQSAEPLQGWDVDEAHRGSMTRASILPRGARARLA